MNYAKEIENIEKKWNYCNSNGWDFASKLLTLAKKQNKELVEQHNYINKLWIPCSERLPEKCTYYNATIQNLDDPKDKKVIDVFYSINDGFRYDGHFNYKVIAWMPLPEPLKGEL